MNGDHKLTFHIDAYSPETIPMAKLADYMADFAALIGSETAVHFGGLETGSTRLAALVKGEDMPKVTARLQDVQRGSPPRDAARLFAQIDAKLASDHAVGRIFLADDRGGGEAELLTFPGRDRPRAQSYGPLTQEGTLDGVLISVGGKDEAVPLRLQNGDTIYTNCDTTRAVARELGWHLFEPIRVHGSGRWVREPDGTWTLSRFRVRRFDVLAKDSLRDSVAALRAVPGNGWQNMANPFSELDELRQDQTELH